MNTHLKIKSFKIGESSTFELGENLESVLDKVKLNGLEVIREKYEERHIKVYNIGYEAVLLFNESNCLIGILDFGLCYDCAISSIDILTEEEMNIDSYIDTLNSEEVKRLNLEELKKQGKIIGNKHYLWDKDTLITQLTNSVISMEENEIMSNYTSDEIDELDSREVLENINLYYNKHITINNRDCSIQILEMKAKDGSESTKLLIIDNENIEDVTFSIKETCISSRME